MKRCACCQVQGSRIRLIHPLCPAQHLVNAIPLQSRTTGFYVLRELLVNSCHKPNLSPFRYLPQHWGQRWNWQRCVGGCPIGDPGCWYTPQQGQRGPQVVQKGTLGGGACVTPAPPHAHVWPYCLTGRLFTPKRYSRLPGGALLDSRVRDSPNHLPLPPTFRCCPSCFLTGSRQYGCRH